MMSTENDWGQSKSYQIFKKNCLSKFLTLEMTDSSRSQYIKISALPELLNWETNEHFQRKRMNAERPSWLDSKGKSEERETLVTRDDGEFQEI